MAGYHLLSIRQVPSRHNSRLQVKLPVVMATSALTFFLFGFGMTQAQHHGILGTSHYLGELPEKYHYDKVVVLCSLSLSMVAIGIQTLSGQVRLNTLVLFSIVANFFIFSPAACWSFGWSFFKHYGFKDFAGAGCVHVCGGLIALVAVSLAGPHFSSLKVRSKLEYMLDSENFTEEAFEDSSNNDDFDEATFIPN